MNRCSFGLHSWSKWYTISEGTQFYRNLITSEKYGRPAVIQERVCNICNKIQRNKVVVE